MDISTRKIAEVVVSVPIHKTLDYFVPEKLRSEIECGKRVLVPFGNRKIIGYIIGFTDKTEQENLKNILKVLDKIPLFTEEFITLTKWMADYYFCSWGEAVHAVAPFKLRGQTNKRFPPKKDLKESPGTHQFLNTPFILTQDQKKCLNPIKENISHNKHRAFLLHGVGGSGKTEIYMESIRYALDRKKQVIFLVPEISLIDDNLDKLQSRFKNEKITLFHSRMSEIQRYNTWLRIRSEEINIIIGTRSAIFAPFDRLGLIIITDEHDTSYKQEQKPMYHTHEVALKRAEYNKAVVLLSSSSPSIESYYKAETGKYELLELSHSIDGKPPAPVKVIDVKEEINRKNRGTFSGELRNAIRDRLDKKEQVVIFLNRRGYANFVICKKCGSALKCPECNVSLSYHIDVHELQCHYCGYKKHTHARENLCPDCRSPLMSYLGKGTQRVEAELRKLFPQAKTMRMDFDTVKKESPEKMVARFNKRQADILIGTQIILRASFLPQVSLIGIIFTDSILNIPDFHSGEYSYCLFSQLIDLVNTGAVGVEAIIQTYNPSHYAVVALKGHNYKEFYKKEIAFREELKYPPFSHLINVIIKGKEEKKVSNIAEELGKALSSDVVKSGTEISILGPSPAALFKLRGFYRWQILIKGGDKNLLHDLIKDVITNRRFPRGLKVSIDMDPLNIT